MVKRELWNGIYFGKKSIPYILLVKWFNYELSMPSYMLSPTFFFLSIYQVSFIFDIIFIFISHSSSYLPWIVGYPFISYELSMHCYQFSIHQLATSYFLYSFFYNYLFRILNDCHRINLDGIIVSSSSVD